MTRAHALGLLLSIPLALACIWHGQQQVNPAARLLLLPPAAAEALR